MIYVAVREMYFKNKPIWIPFPTNMIPYEDVSFHYWVYKIDSAEFPFCTAEFKKAYNDNLVWERLQR